MPKNPEREGSPRLITITEIAEEYGVSRATVHNYRRGGTFPRPAPVEGTEKTKLRFRADEVAAWFEANPKQQGRRTDLPPKQQQGDPMTTPAPPAVDPRIAVLSAISSPEWHPVPEAHGMPWDEAVKLLDAYRAKVLRLAAEAIEQEFLDGITDSERDQTWNAAIKAAATSLRQSAAKPEAQDG